MDARQLMAEMFIELGWPLAEVDLAAQPDTAVRLLVSAFKNRARNLPKPVCLVFDGFTSGTADEFARRFVVGMANAANEDLDLDVRVVLLEVEAQLPAILELEALSENLGNGGGRPSGLLQGDRQSRRRTSRRRCHEDPGGYGSSARRRTPPSSR